MRLDDVCILDLSRLLPGPYATQLLSDMGAEVVKVEDPGSGDYMRDIEPKIDGVGAVFAAVNQGKRSVTLDLKSSAGRDAFLRLVEKADVVFESFRPGVVDELEIGYEVVKERSPDIVYCSLSGYGQTGPYRHRVGHDLNYIGLTGLLDLTRPSKDTAPTIPGFPIADMAGGLFAAFSIISALYSRECTDSGGEYIDIAMSDVVLSFSQAVAPLAMTGGDPRAGETPLTGQFPSYDIYETKDGRYVALAAVEPEFWENFCTAVGREDLVADHMAQSRDDRDRVRSELAKLFRTKTAAQWKQQLDGEEAMFDRVYTLSEALAHPQIQAREMTTTSPYPRIRFPAITSSELDRHDSIPGHGEHTNEVLREHGLTDEEIERCTNQGNEENKRTDSD